MPNQLFFQRISNALPVRPSSLRDIGKGASIALVGLLLAACSSPNEEPAAASPAASAPAEEQAATQTTSAFQICNLTSSTVGVAIGYRDGEDMVTEGWWTLPPGSDEQSCVAPDALAGPLQDRYYYVYAVDYTLGGAWAGNTFMCTSDQAFTIRGVEDCVARGYDRTGFVEVDTGGRSVHIVQLTDQQGVSAR